MHKNLFLTTPDALKIPFLTKFLVSWQKAQMHQKLYIYTTLGVKNKYFMTMHLVNWQYAQIN
jgi:hypothetical protein